MRKALHLLAFTLLFLPNLFGQKYINETSQWFEFTAFSNDSIILFSNIQVVKDTTINSNSYYKMQTSYQTLVFLPSTPDSLDILGIFQGKSHFWYIREDASKIFQWQNNQDVLLYDFEMQLGDTLEFGEVIIKIDSFYFQNEYRRRYHTSHLGYIIYEGIGSKVSFPFGNFLGSCDFSILKCYSQNGETLNIHEGPFNLFTGSAYFTLNDTCIMLDNIFTHLDDVVAYEIDDLIIYPNPVINSFTIASGQNIQSYRIYDALGNMINEVVVHHDSDLQYDMTTENSGIYFIVAKTNHAIRSSKILKH